MAFIQAVSFQQQKKELNIVTEFGVDFYANNYQHMLVLLNA